MKHTGTILLYLASLFGAAGLGGCIREAGSECPVTAHLLIVSSYDADNKEITGSGAVREVALYVFDAKDAYVETISCKENERVRLPYAVGSRITVVGWGNSRSDLQKMPALTVGTSLEKALVMLLPAPTRAAESRSLSPDDLFFGTAALTLADDPQHPQILHSLPVKRKTSSMSIVVKGIRSWLGVSDNDFSFSVRGTFAALDFNGKPAGDPTSYDPAVTPDKDGSFVTGIFKTFPSGDSPVSVDIYHGAERVYTVSIGQDGKALTLPEGRLVNVLVDFTGNARVSISVTEWGKADINQEF